MRFVAIFLLVLAACRPSPAPPVPFVFLDHLAEAEKELDEKQLRSSRPGGRLASAVTLGRETRQALLPPLPSELGFDVEVPPRAFLGFAIGVSTLGEEVSPAPVHFSVRLEEESGRETTIFDEVVLRREANRFFDHGIDLSPWSGSRVRVTLETRSETSPELGADLPLLAYWANPVLVSREKRRGPPNVILISLDCVRADHLGTYGYSRPTSPRIDDFAREAFVFETALAVSSFTHPTHMTMLTGLPPSIHGVSRSERPDAAVEYLPEILARAGYRASGVVSGPLLSQSFGFDRGFHVYHAFHEQTRAPELRRAALQMLQRGRGQPQFLFLHFFDAHWPYWPPDEFNTRFGERSVDASSLLEKVRHQLPPESPEEVQLAIDLYDGDLAYLDREVGRFLDELQRMGLFESSLVILTADHGEAFLEHGFWEHGQTLYEEMVHVPLIVKWPGRSPRGRTAALVSQTDLFPTMLEAAGLSVRGEGVSLRRTLEDPLPGREVVLEVTWDPLPDREARMLVAWRGERYKYIASLQAPTVDELYSAEIRGEELYDLTSDPGETKNIAGSAEETAGKMRESVLAYLARAGELQSGDGPEVTIDEELRKRLESLGYLEK